MPCPDDARPTYAIGRLLVVVAALLFGIVQVPGVAAQTLEIQEGIAASLEQSSWLGCLKWAWRWAHILGTEVDIADFNRPLTFKAALDAAYDQMGARGIELDFLVDRTELEKDGAGNCMECPIDLSALPRRVTLHRFLREVLAQLPGPEASVVLRHTYLEITSLKAAHGRDRSFHFLGGAAPVARIWLVIAAGATLLYLGLRAPAVVRRTERRLAGCAGLVLRAGLVFLFWPVWLVAAGLGVLRRGMGSAP